MGGELSAAPAGVAPALIVQAMRDPKGANLDRIQVVKGWIDSSGETHERVYDVVGSGERAPGADGRLPPVGSTVDLATATYTNEIGSPDLSALFRDPDFDPSQAAFYYVRVLEIPTPRHSVFDALALGQELSEAHGDPEIQERAYTSPIWYRP